MERSLFDKKYHYIEEILCEEESTKDSISQLLLGQGHAITTSHTSREGKVFWKIDILKEYSEEEYEEYEKNKEKMLKEIDERVAKNNQK